MQILEDNMGDANERWPPGVSVAAQQDDSVDKKLLHF